jgi:hypothetical protein
LNRRNLIQLIAALSGTQLAGGYLTAHAAHSELQLAAALGDPALLGAFGTHCFAAMPLARPVLLEKCGLAIVQDAAVSDQLQAFAERRRADWQLGRIVTVDGWVLAEAECALCGLIAAH